MDTFKQELNDYIKNELNAIEKEDEEGWFNKDMLMGMRAAYLSIKNIFLEEE